MVKWTKTLLILFKITSRFVINGRCGSKFQNWNLRYARSFKDAREQRQYIINVQKNIEILKAVIVTADRYYLWFLICLRLRSWGTIGVLRTTSTVWCASHCRSHQLNRRSDSYLLDWWGDSELLNWWSNTHRLHWGSHSDLLHRWGNTHHLHWRCYSHLLL